MNIYDIKRDSDAKDQWFTMTSKIRVPVKVAGNSYYLPATSNAGLFKGYVIDPGSVGYDDFGQDNVHSVLITHGHNGERAKEDKEKVKQNALAALALNVVIIHSIPESFFTPRRLHPSV